MYHHTWIILHVYVQMESHYVAQAGPKLLASSNPPALTSQCAGIRDMNHHAHLDTISQKMVEIVSPAKMDRTIPLTLMTSFPAFAVQSKVEIRSCTTITDTVCQCEEGTFQEEDSPEICRKCSTGCPRGMVKVSDCKPWSDIKCVHKESGVITGIVVPLVFVAVAGFVWKTSLWKKVLPYLKGIGSGRGRNLERVDRSSHAQGGPGTEDNVHNETMSILQPIQNPEQEMEVQEPVVAGDNVLPAGEPEHLLEPAEAEGSQRRRLLVPANGADSTETLRQCFHHFTDHVPFNSWVPFGRELGLTGNEIDVARVEAAGPGDTLYEMLRKWLSKTGRDASVHTLLDALETLGQRLAKQKIQDCLVSSRKFVYLEDNADSAIS
ncbi:Tumor necrosis factor receptor superfamily member 10B [Plecturocebus cupreus]